MLVKISAPGAWLLTWDVTYDSTVLPNMLRRFQKASDSGFVTVVQDLVQTIASGELVGGADIDLSALATNPVTEYTSGAPDGLITESGTFYHRERIETPDRVTHSNWSNTLSDTVA